MNKVKNPYNRGSKRIFEVVCECGEKHPLLEGYAYYLFEFTLTPEGSKTDIVCPICNVPLELPIPSDKN